LNSGHIKIHANQETIAYWQEWVETIMVYKLPKLSRQEIQEMLGYNDIELKQTQFYQDVFSEGVQEGKLEGESTIILRILKRRLGPLNEKTILEIQTLNNQQLEALSDNLLDFSSKNDLDNWLEQNQ
jgi:predicted transposase YdaD